MNTRSVRATAPGKIILSGEHAVVHGAPALVTAVQCRARATVSRRPRPGIGIRLPDLGAECETSMEQIRQLGDAVSDRHRAFLEGRTGSEAVLTEPAHLVQLGLLAVASALGGVDLDGLDIEVTSEIPVGRGMGSSAAVITALVQALAADLSSPLSREELVTLVQDVEKYQHGRPSGVDARACVHGGAFQFRRGEGTARLRLAWGPLFLVDTGEPASSTGECVEAVRRRFEDDAIWTDFEEVTLALATALQDPGSSDAAGWIRRNHELLVRIGVVPDRVVAFIDALHRRGYAAKVCGAGAVRGDRAGMVLVCGENVPEELCAHAGYPLSLLEPDEDGVTTLR